jgi:Methionine gamma-lyase
MASSQAASKTASFGRRNLRANGDRRSASRSNWATADVQLLAVDAPSTSAGSFNGHTRQVCACLYILLLQERNAPFHSLPSKRSSLVCLTDGVIIVQLVRVQSLFELAKGCQDDFHEIDLLTEANMSRIQQAMALNAIGPHHFAGSTGYGHGDLGRAAFDRVRRGATIRMTLLHLPARAPEVTSVLAAMFDGIGVSVRISEELVACRW